MLFFVPNTRVIFPNALKLFHLLLSILLATLFLVLFILFVIRLVRAKRRNITHEQIWVAILLFVTFMYFDIIENIIDATHVIESIRYFNSVTPGETATGLVRTTFPDWVIRISDVFDSLRVAAFTAFIYFYLLANLHSYRILDPCARLGWRFYAPKLVILLPFLIFQLIIYHVVGLELSEIPLLSAPAFAFIFAPYRIWGYIGWEMILTIIKTTCDALLVGLIFYEASKTMRVLEHAPYMKYRAKRVGFRFFLYVNFMFYSCFFVLYWVTLFARPVGDVVSRIVPPADQPRAGVTWFHSTGVWFLITGYVLCTAYVHLPHTSVGWLSGWFTSSTLAPSSSMWSRDGGSDSHFGTTKGSEFDSSTIRSSSKSKHTDRRPTTITSMDTSTEKGLSHHHHQHQALQQHLKLHQRLVQSQSQTNHPRWKHSKSHNDTTWSTDNVEHEDEAAPQSSLVDNDDELQQQIVEPITYRKRESKDSLELKANCFTMQTHVIMFNFAWYVYYYGTPKLDKFRPTENPLPFAFSVDKHIRSANTDTQALVLDCTDRIIITFKGTTSLKNLCTSLKVHHELLRNVVRLNADGGDESNRLKKLFGARYLQGKIHSGFATAYLSVMDDIVERVRALRDKKLRPVFLTGHSLGGALATLCSLDLWVKLNISRREIFVSTFGSPRIGNAYFAAVYREVVPLHWRIVVDPDMIARLPRGGGYTHVGKKVVLTPHGDMIIDPSALEQRPWSGETAGIAYHRKASYLLAMRAWCVRNHGMTYTPVFWPFPVHPEDERRFASAFDLGDDDDDDYGGRSGSGGGRGNDARYYSSKRKRAAVVGHQHGGEKKERVAQKIIKLDAMVDALAGGHEDFFNMAAVEKWARLTRRVLLSETLGGGAPVSVPAPPCSSAK